MKRALISVSDKAGVVDFAKVLCEAGYEIISTGGTYKVLLENNIDVKEVTDITKFPECLDGRVKTLHPSVHGGILARRDDESHTKQLKELEIDYIDIVVVNLYPFKATLMNEKSTHEDIVENIDIGGPTMLRSAAKNYKDVLVVCDPQDYDLISEKIKSGEEISEKTRATFAFKVFEHTAHYDTLIFDYFKGYALSGGDEHRNVTMTFDIENKLRYGENPHQKAWILKDPIPNPNSVASLIQLHGKELSFNNYNDLNAAVRLVREYENPCMIALKHTNPCGVGTGHDLITAFKKAYESDKVSIFGGIVAVNREIDDEVAEKLSEIFLEVIVAPSYSKEALEILTKKKNVRLLEIPTNVKVEEKFDVKKIEGGLLLQEADELSEYEIKVVTERIPTEGEIKNLKESFKVVKHIKSNGIVLYKNGGTVGLSPGQTSRVLAVENSIKQAGSKAKGAVLASDAFFPFKDSIELAAKAGVSAIIQPGGSVKDEEVIAECNKHGIAMVFTGVRHFKH